MTTATIQSAATTLRAPGVEFGFDEAQLAAVSFLARYSRRTLEAYRHDLRGFFQWAADNGVAVLEASRGHIEVFRAWMEDRGLAASTIDRRLSTGLWLLPVRAHRRTHPFEPRPVRPPSPGFTPPTHAGWIAPSPACSSSPPSSTTGTTPRLPCCSD
jgi:hypothetical protein